MAHKTPSEAEVARTLSDLKISSKVPQKAASKPKSAPVADSWDDDVSSGSDTETEDLSRCTTSNSQKDLSPIKTEPSYEPPNPPPPTPASPTPFDFPSNTSYGEGLGQGRGSSSSREASRGGSGSASPARRPDKTTAVAGRLIAGALGVRAPKRTEEEREYDRAMREKERKRKEEERNREVVEKNAVEERKRAVWED